jgi:phosphoserine phosphatase RsbU/P
MNEKKWIPLLLIGLLGLAAFVGLTTRVNPRASVDLRLDRTEILKAGTAYLTGLGFRLDGLRQDGWFSLDASSAIYFQRTQGMEGANNMLRADSIPAHHWYMTWYDMAVSRSQNREQFSVWMRPGGGVLGFEHTVQDSVSLPSLDNQAAESLARAFLEGQGIRLASFTLRSATDIKLANRTDHRFVWVRPGETSETTVWVRVLGNGIGGFRAEFSPTGSFERRLTEVSTVATLMVMASFAFVFLLILYVVILFLRKYHEGEVGTRTGIMVFIGVFAVSVAALANEFPRVGAGAGVGDLNFFNVKMVVFFLNVFVVQVFVGAMVFGAWCVGESSARAVWPGKMTAADSALARKFLTLDLGRSILTGYGWGLVLAGLISAGAYGLLVWGGRSVYLTGLSGIPEAYVSGAHPIFYALSTAAFAEIVFRLFFISYLKEKLHRTWPGVLISTLLWSAAGLTMWELPIGMFDPWTTVGALFLFGLAMSALFLRHDLVTAMTADFVVVALGMAVPLFVSTGTAFTSGRLIFIALFLLPALIGVGGLVRRGRFVFTVETMPAHIRRITERERMAKELEIARSVQMSLLPKTNPLVAGYDIAGICIPAMEVGGDYYDFVNLAGKKIGIAIGDVSGKGVPAAIYMTLTKGILQSHAEDNVSPKNVLAKVNSLMYRTIERNSFVSMFYAILDTQEKSIRFARAGQCPVILTQKAGEKGSFLTPKGMALGLEMGKVFDSVLEEQEISLHQGEVLVFYTDGFTEAMNDRQEEYGEERLQDAIARQRQKSAGEIIKGLCADVRAFTGDAPQHDDMTMVVVKVE